MRLRSCLHYSVVCTQKQEAISYLKWLILKKLFLKFYTAQKMKFSIKDFFSKCGQIRSFLRIWLHLLKKSLIENFILCSVSFKLF